LKARAAGTGLTVPVEGRDLKRRPGGKEAYDDKERGQQQKYPTAASGEETFGHEGALRQRGEQNDGWREVGPVRQ